MNNPLEHTHREEEGHWISVSDLMSGLMMVFMLVAIVFMISVETERDKIRDVAILYDTLRTQLYEDLYNEFKPDMARWGAEIDKDLTFRFNNTEVLFDQGKADLKDEFKNILSEFFPRYLRIITQEKYRHDILEVRIEGHTSSGWAGAKDADEAYVRNMNLSQERTRSALVYVLELPQVEAEKPWLKTHLTANGLASAKVIRDANNKEDFERSRRVEFKVRTDAEGRIATILEQVQ